MASLRLESDQLEDEMPPAEPAPVTPPKKTTKGKRKSSKKEKQQREDSKKCSECHKTKDAAAFNEDQNRCRDCFNDVRALYRVAKTQGCTAAVTELRTNSPRGFQALQKAFAKERDEVRRSGRKLKFQVHVFIQSLEKRAGFRSSEIGEMMWEGEFYAHCETAKMGFLSRQEANQLWKTYLAEAERGDRATDEDGPRGYKRVWVKTKDQGEKYSDLSKARRYESQEQMRRVSEAQAEARRALVLSDVALGGDTENDDFEQLRGQAQRSCGSGGTSLEDLTMPDVQEMLREAKHRHSAKGRGKGAALARSGSGGKVRGLRV